MASGSTVFLTFLVVYIFHLITTSLADCSITAFGNRYTNCRYGCCGSHCCTRQFNLVGLIVGVCVGVGTLIVIICVIVCICRRRRTAGVVVHSQPGMVIQQSTMMTQGGVLVPGAAQPGVVYPPQGYGCPPQPYGAYPQPGYYPTNYPLPYPTSSAPPYEYNPAQQPMADAPFKN
ncbi:protein shisa-5-like [Biomphalaria glabrata]|uniref:Protein shisa-5-like n=1 Tax=Biomphalaria glabrata TaxID=6526 RepID=A0A9W3A7W5_BIOGL|nr:protein shisa-5-like [Biomphalaria glabrata]KAI8731128.1 hypothetical protein BgiMline_030753 [Biomphalaria glabrata]